MKFIPNPDIQIEATQWFKDGDHPAVIRSNVVVVDVGGNIPAYRSEDRLIATLEGNMMVMAGDWIITGLEGEFYPCKPSIFEKKYKPIQDSETALEYMTFQDIYWLGYCHGLAIMLLAWIAYMLLLSDNLPPPSMS